MLVEAEAGTGLVAVSAHRAATGKVAVVGGLGALEMAGIADPAVSAAARVVGDACSMAAAGRVAAVVPSHGTVHLAAPSTVTLRTVAPAVHTAVSLVGTGSIVVHCVVAVEDARADAIALRTPVAVGTLGDARVTATDLARRIAVDLELVARSRLAVFARTVPARGATGAWSVGVIGGTSNRAVVGLVERVADRAVEACVEAEESVGVAAALTCSGVASSVTRTNVCAVPGGALFVAERSPVA